MEHFVSHMFVKITLSEVDIVGAFPIFDILNIF